MKKTYLVIGLLLSTTFSNPMEDEKPKKPLEVSLQIDRRNIEEYRTAVRFGFLQMNMSTDPENDTNIVIRDVRNTQNLSLPISEVVTQITTDIKDAQDVEMIAMKVATSFGRDVATPDRNAFMTEQKLQFHKFMLTGIYYAFLNDWSTHNTSKLKKAAKDLPRNYFADNVNEAERETASLNHFQQMHVLLTQLRSGNPKNAAHVCAAYRKSDQFKALKPGLDYKTFITDFILMMDTKSRDVKNKPELITKITAKYKKRPVFYNLCPELEEEG